MKKKVLIGVSGVFVIILGLCIYFYVSKNSDNEIYQAKVEEKVENQVGGFLTLMLEQEDGTYKKSTSNSWPEDGYIFNENLSSCENGGELTWNEELNTINLKTNNSERCFVYFDKEPEIIYLADYIINNVYVEDGVNGLYYHDGVGTYTNADQEAGDNSYRYSGANPNNYVCFGSDEPICPEESLYRIIGIFREQVKLIKATGFGNYVWDSEDSYAWNAGIKPDIYTTLNDIFYNEINYNWKKTIDENYKWSVGGIKTFVLTVQQIYSAEIVNNPFEYIETMPIGLMFVNDYGYSASPENWNLNVSNYIDTIDNWMYTNEQEWTISSYRGSVNAVCRISDGYLTSAGGVNYLAAKASLKIRPCFYLNSDVAYASGDGSIENPFRIVV